MLEPTPTSLQRTLIDATDANVIVIEASRGAPRIPFAEIYRQRELLGLLIRRQLATRYRQMALGIVWMLLEPLAQLLLISVVFGMLLRVESNGYPYTVYAFAGLTPWWLFSRTVLAVAGCLQDNLPLISKVYFPRLLLVLAAAAREYVDGLVAFVLLLITAASFGFLPSVKLLLAPLVMVLVSLTGVSIGLWFAAVMVRFRDVRPALGVALQAGMYATPILYAATLVPPPLREFYQLNPMLWAVEIFRWLLLDAPLVLTRSLPLALALVVVTLISGLLVFSTQEQVTVDVQ